MIKIIALLKVAQCLLSWKLKSLAGCTAAATLGYYSTLSKSTKQQLKLKVKNISLFSQFILVLEWNQMQRIIREESFWNVQPKSSESMSASYSLSKLWGLYCGFEKKCSNLKLLLGYCFQSAVQTLRTAQGKLHSFLHRLKRKLIKNIFTNNKKITIAF